MKKSAVILAGGFSERFGQDKGLIELAGKPLVLHVLDRTVDMVDEAVVVVSSDVQKRAFTSSLHNRADVVVDKLQIRSPLVGALTGFENVQGKYSLLLPCDTPLISSRVVSLLLDLCINRNATIPRWPNGYIEPLQAAYNRESASKAARTALEQEKFDLQSMVSHLTKVRYISTIVLRQMDSELLTFFNINTPEDLKRAESVLQHKLGKVENEY